MMTPGQTYTLTGSDIYRAETLPNSRLFLKDLNRSKTWHPPGTTVTQGYAQGYLVSGDRLDLYAFDIAGGMIKDRIEAQPTQYTVNDLRPCKDQKTVIDLMNWQPA